MSAPGHGPLLHIDRAQGEALRERRPAQGAGERLAGQFKALGEPTRLGLALALRESPELCVCDLSWVAERPQNLISHHMKILRTEGLVSARKDGRMTMYRLSAAGHAFLEAAVARLEDTSDE